MRPSLFCASQPVAAFVVPVQSGNGLALLRDSVVWYRLDEAKDAEHPERGGQRNLLAQDPVTSQRATSQAGGQ